MINKAACFITLTQDNASPPPRNRATCEREKNFEKSLRMTVVGLLVCSIAATRVRWRMLWRVACTHINGEEATRDTRIKSMTSHVDSLP